MSKKKIIKLVGFAICLIFMVGFMFAKSTLAAQEETTDQNTQDITLTLLPKKSGSSGTNSGSNSSNNANTVFPPTGEQRDNLLAILGYVVVGMGIIYIVYRTRRKVEK